MTLKSPNSSRSPKLEFETLRYTRDPSGVVYLSIDVKGRSVNVLTPELHREIGLAADVLRSDDNAIGAIVHSGKKSFMAGGDLKRIVNYYDQGRTALEAYSQSRTYSESLRRLETCGKPIAVAINGSALGGGLELALACHYRVVADDNSIRLGLPEVGLGLIPGGGGTQRLPRLIGIESAADMIIDGRLLSPSDAEAGGVVDRVVPEGALLMAAQEWILERPDTRQPWDRSRFTVPGGSGLGDRRIAALFQILTAKVGAKFRHNYPAPVAALRCLFNGTTVRSMEQSLDIETQEFSALTRDPVARNLIRTLFINRSRADLEELLEDPASLELKRRCLGAYDRLAESLVAMGVTATSIRNCATAVGFPEPPSLGPRESTTAPVKASGPVDTSSIGQALLCTQALEATRCWEEGLTTPVKADLVSHYGWGFPSYTGGVMSFIDTLGLPAFVEQCDHLRPLIAADLNPSNWLRDKADRDERLFPVADSQTH